MAAHWQPDPAKGVFETLLVLDGSPVELDAHLARLRASLAALYPDAAPPTLDVPDAPGAGVLRISVAPGANGELAVRTDRRPASGHFATENGGQRFNQAISLSSMALAGGLGARKWADRAPLDEAQARMPGDTLPLILDEDGTVLEASRANVFAVRGDALFTPPLDGRILPGVTRSRVLEIAMEKRISVQERSVSARDLLTAEGVFLTGSVRGLEPVDSLDGTVLGVRNDIVNRIATELWRRWQKDAAAPKSSERDEREAGGAGDQAGWSRDDSRAAALRGTSGRGHIRAVSLASSGPRSSREGL